MPEPQQKPPSGPSALLLIVPMLACCGLPLLIVAGGALVAAVGGVALAVVAAVLLGAVGLILTRRSRSRHEEVAAAVPRARHNTRSNTSKKAIAELMRSAWRAVGRIGEASCCAPRRVKHDPPIGQRLDLDPPSGPTARAASPRHEPDRTREPV